MLQTILDEPMSPWMKGNEKAHPIVLSSRIRLARNFKGIPFTNRGKKESIETVERQMRSAMNPLQDAYGMTFTKINLETLEPIERDVLVEKHLISPNLAESYQGRSVIISEDCRISIMVNEEDHLRIQSMELGLQLEEAYQKAMIIDDAIESKYDYAFSKEFGYLTACPTNVGTGLRASVMVHVPALAMTGKLQRIIRSIIRMGYSVRGLYGEGSEGLGHVYQISNQQTMGISEEATIEQLSQIVRGVVKEEEASRSELWSTDREGIEDRVWRSYGIVSHARRISGEEALSLLSDVQLGVDMKLLPVTLNFQELLVITRPNFLGKLVGKPAMGTQERDSRRAQVIRDTLERGSKGGTL